MHIFVCVCVCMCVCVRVCSYGHITKAVYSHLPACGDSAVYDLSNSLHLVCLARTRAEHLDKVCEDPGPSRTRVIIIWQAPRDGV